MYNLLKTLYSHYQASEVHPETRNPFSKGISDLNLHLTRVRNAIKKIVLVNRGLYKEGRLEFITVVIRLA
jgi:hypothetical protein